MGLIVVDDNFAGSVTRVYGVVLVNISCEKCRLVVQQRREPNTQAADRFGYVFVGLRARDQIPTCRRLRRCIQTVIVPVVVGRWGCIWEAGET